jgi:nitrite reductase/ring-hydroxylating ferredoxin subunit
MDERTSGSAAVRAGSRHELERDGRLVTKVGELPVLVVWHDGRAAAIEDRCPHMGFPLHQGTVESGLLTCHWHHARFDLESGCTLDPWADDAAGFDVRVDADDVLVAPRPVSDVAGRLRSRLRDGLEQGLTLVLAKATLGLLETEGGAAGIVRTAVDFGTTYRDEGWGSGLTVLAAMANLLDHLDSSDRALALVHALAFVGRDTRGHRPRFPEPALATTALTGDRLEAWYRRFVETRSSDAAERSLATAVATLPITTVARLMTAACTDHVFLDEGHTIDFTNKAFEAIDLLGPEVAPAVLSSLVAQTCSADRAEESGEWRHPHDLAALARRAEVELGAAVDKGQGRAFDGVAALGWALLDDDAEALVTALIDAAAAGADPEQLARSVALAAALRITRFHTQNDHGDWDTVHHAFTTANAVHQLTVRTPSPELLRAVVHGALRVHLDRFLNVPAARLPSGSDGGLDQLAECWDVQGAVDRAGAIVYAHVRDGGERGRAEAIAALGHALLQEDAGFHWFQVVEAGARQARAWPAGSEEAALILTGVARFLAAHTPTRRELPTVVRIASRLRRGEQLFEES